MIVCSCNVISDHDIEAALIEIMSRDNPPLPTPGVVWRHLAGRMRCCGCAPLAIETIYAKMEQLEARGLIGADAGRTMRDQLLRRSHRGGGRSQQHSDSNAGDVVADDDEPELWLAAE